MRPSIHRSSTPQASPVKKILRANSRSGGLDFHWDDWADQGDHDIRCQQGGETCYLCCPVRRKCYPHLGDFKSQHLAPQGLKGSAWRILDRLSGDLYVLSQTQNSIVRYAPLYIHSFVLCAPRKILEATQFNQRYRRYEEIDNVPDRLRWCRHSKGLMQVEVADKVGMTHSVYKAIEEGFTQHVEPDKVDRLAQFYGVPVTDFLDEFNHFLYDGQAVRIRAYRESFGMGKKPFARKMGIPVRCLQEWESGRKVISIKCWERHFKGRA